MCVHMHVCNSVCAQCVCAIVYVHSVCVCYALIEYVYQCIFMPLICVLHVFRHCMFSFNYAVKCFESLKATVNSLLLLLLLHFVS